MSNKRKYERYNLGLTVSLKDKQGKHKIHTGNISKYGLFLITEDPKPDRQLIQLVIDIGTAGGEIDALAQVMWTDAEGTSERSGGMKGMGVKFFSLPDQSRQKWENFVDAVRTGRVPEDVAPKETAPKPGAAGANADDNSVYTIGEEELEELEDLNLEEVSSEIEEEIIDIEEEEEEEERVEDLSSFEQEYEAKDGEVLMPSDDELERREFPRKPVAFLVKLQDVDTMRESLTRDISLGGMFLKTSLEKDIDEPVDVVVVHPWTGEEFTLNAVVRRVEKEGNGETGGLGVEFTNIDDNLRDSLLTYIESGFVIFKKEDDLPIESEIIKRIEQVEEKIKGNPIDSRLHYEVGLLYLCLSDWEKSHEHVDIATKLGYSVPKDVADRLSRKIS